MTEEINIYDDIDFDNLENALDKQKGIVLFEVLDPIYDFLLNVYDVHEGKESEQAEKMLDGYYEIEAGGFIENEIDFLTYYISYFEKTRNHKALYEIHKFLYIAEKWKKKADKEVLR